MTQIAITAVNNKNLFSNYYLDNQIKNNPEWKKKEHIEAFNKIKRIYNAESAFLETLNEKQLEQRFFAPIFKILNLTFEVNESTGYQEFPDYAFFSDRNSLDDAHQNKGTHSFYNNAFAIGEVKRWSIELDRFGRDKNNRKRNPSLQIWIYLHDVTPKWGILTNGASWRLYCKDSGRYEYYEVDLPTLIATDNIEKFRYFYYFFRREAFPFQDVDPFLERVLQGSVDYANEIGDDLKDNVYKAMKKIAEGFFNRTENGLDIQNEEHRDIVQKNTMLLLYRFLFLLYAEGKELLDVRHGRYHTYSFYKLKNEVKENRDGPLEQKYLPVGTSLWSKLNDLFRLISQGSKSFGIPENELFVPAYNGGLFDPKKNPELEKWVIGNSFLAEAIDLLSRSNVGGKLDFVDYSTLEIRHLGSIYEGLLEYKLKIAEEDMVVKGGEWVNLDAFNKGRKQIKSFSDFGEFERVHCGQLFLATDKGERKATGSYYTPDYIVNYIVSNTVGPVVEDKWQEAQAKDQSFVDATLSVKVLDPAMGSGHFLVGAIEFLSGKLLEAAQKDIEAGRISEDDYFTPDWARREVVAHCIYGVDLNDLAVELAKVSLWLTTISKDKPLSFLDHRLKQGNSLIGAHLSDIKNYPSGKKKQKDHTLPSFISPLFITHLIGKIAELETISDESLENIKRKEQVFEEFKQLPEYRKAKALANVYTGVYFGNEVIPTQNKDSANVYYNLFWAIMGDENEWRRKTNREWFLNANKIADDKSFFHWELEYPEIFFASGAQKENSGWDAVIGNPPYGYIQDEELKYFIKQIYRFKENKYESYNFFMEKGILLTRKDGMFSFIVPISWMEYIRTVKLRQIILAETQIKYLCRLVENPFEEANVEPCIFILKNQKPSDLEESICDIKIFSNKLKITNHYSYNQKDWYKNIDSKIILKADKSPQIGDLKNKNILQLNNFIEAIQGIIPYHLPEFTKKLGKEKAEYIVKNRIYHTRFQKGSDYRRVLIGSDIGRYQLEWNSREWLKYGPWLARAKEERFFSQPRILVQRIRNLRLARRIIATYTNEDYLNEAGLATLIQKNQSYRLYFILSILNSALINKFFRENFFDTNIKPTDILKIPIRCISFTTPSDYRTTLVNEAMVLYSKFLNTSDIINKILDFVTARLDSSPEESDVVHDLLAYLAEQMIEMNKEKNAEIKSFLEWFERENGVQINTLTNKTKLKKYHELDFNSFINILKKNKKKIPVNLSNREFQKNLDIEFNKSLSKLKPLKEKIEKTDWLIDQIVYKLYRLTEDEIKIVEESITA